MAGLDFASISSMIPSWMFSLQVWIAILIVLPLCLFLILWYIKNTKLRYAVVEIRDRGGLTQDGMGKVNFNFLGAKGAGYFGSKWKMNGLISYGTPLVMRLKTGEIVEQFNEQCLQEINGRIGFLVFKDPETRVVIPVGGLDVEAEKTEVKEAGTGAVTGFKITNRTVLATLSGTDYSNTSVDIIKARTAETADRMSVLAQAVVIGIIAIVTILAILFTFNYVSKTSAGMQEVAAQTINQCASTIKEVCQTVVSQYAKPGVSP